MFPVVKQGLTFKKTIFTTLLSTLILSTFMSYLTFDEEHFTDFVMR